MKPRNMKERKIDVIANIVFRINSTQIKITYLSLWYDPTSISEKQLFYIEREADCMDFVVSESD